MYQDTERTGAMIEKCGATANNPKHGAASGPKVLQNSESFPGGITEYDARIKKCYLGVLSIAGEVGVLTAR